MASVNAAIVIIEEQRTSAPLANSYPVISKSLAASRGDPISLGARKADLGTMLVEDPAAMTDAMPGGPVRWRPPLFRRVVPVPLSMKDKTNGAEKDGLTTDSGERIKRTKGELLEYSK